MMGAFLATSAAAQSSGEGLRPSGPRTGNMMVEKEYRGGMEGLSI